MAADITLPELGDGIDSGDVLEVLVRAGDIISKDQGIVELETDKATVEVPCPLAGKVLTVHVKEGDTVPISGLLITVDAAEKPQSRPTSATPPAEGAVAPSAVTSGSPSRAESAKAAESRSREFSAIEPALPQQQPAGSAPASDEKAGNNPEGPIPAVPAVRRFAREGGADLRELTGSGQGGRITRSDVLAVVRQASQAAREQRTTTKSGQVPTEKDAFGPIHVEKMSRVRRTISEKMHESWSTVPRVTNFDDADLTELEQFRNASKNDYAEKGIKLTSMPFVIKAVAMALEDHPLINASLDIENQQIIYKDYISIGIAVDTERGLVVPALRRADELSIPEIASELAQVAQKARDGDFSVEDLRGGTFTISNLGVIGGSYSTPIINVPEVAILLLGRSRKTPTVVDDQIRIRLMMPLSLSYDHRLVDGATAARFLNDVKSFLEAPSRLLLAP